MRTGRARAYCRLLSLSDFALSNRRMIKRTTAACFATPLVEVTVANLHFTHFDHSGRVLIFLPVQFKKRGGRRELELVHRI